jgi:hypothetical protein
MIFDKDFDFELHVDSDGPMELQPGGWIRVRLKIQVEIRTNRLPILKPLFFLIIWYIKSTRKTKRGVFVGISVRLTNFYEDVNVVLC